MSSTVTMGPPKPLLPAHFETKAQHNEVNILGMWLFLAQEIMFFGGMFCAYAVYRYKYPDIWGHAATLLNTKIGAFNTCVLLASSLTMAMSVYYTQVGKKWPLVWNFIITIALGCVFLIVKAFEYAEKYDHGLIPNLSWHPHLENTADLVSNPANLKLFFVLYFTMTGMHAFHMIIGVAIGAVMLVLILKNKFGPNRFMPVEMFGFYWHFVDIVWVFLFPMIYLIPKP